MRQAGISFTASPLAKISSQAQPGRELAASPQKVSRAHPLPPVTQARSSSITDEFKRFDGGDKDGDDDDDDDDDEGGIKGDMDAAFLDRELLKTIMAQKDPDLLRALGHQFEDFVLYCTYLGVNCA